MAPIPTPRDLLVASGLAPLAGAHAVLRRDYSGVVYLVAKDLSEPAARFLAAHYNGLGHHQAYWAEHPRFDPRRFEPNDIVPGPS